MRSFAVIAFLAVAMVHLLPFLQPRELDSREHLLVEITGDPARAEFVMSAVRRAVSWERSVDAPLVFPTGIHDLPPGGETHLTVRAEGETAGGKSVEMVFPVIVRNVMLPWKDADTLFVSNSPETLPWAKGLFRGVLGLGEVVRLLYHHRNGAEGRPILLLVRVANPSPRPARVWVSDAHAGPMRDGLYVGHAAASRWLRLYWSGTGQILEIPPHSTRSLSELKLPPDQVGSGVLQMRLLQGKEVVVDVAGVLDKDLEPAQESYVINRDTRHIRGTFPSPRRDVVLGYGSGGTVSVAIGSREDATGPASGGSLYGSYGVIYTVRANLMNPGAGPVQVAVRVMALAGPARGTFLINGVVSEVSLSPHGAPQTIATIRLGPLESRVLFVSTMPEAGSTYPIRMVLAPL